MAALAMSNKLKYAKISYGLSTEWCVMVITVFVVCFAM